MSLEWLLVPGGIAFFFGLFNAKYYTLHDSPLNSVYSILVAIWATLFVVVSLSLSRGFAIVNFEIVLEETVTQTADRVGQLQREGLGRG